ncbi:MAG: hypothetical protein EP349_05050 [Alphaproteobacteria bacterium]|nr:MAG: hypothetical protein EP349_05050 [Alphaproteobacteria bacterium]
MKYFAVVVICTLLSLAPHAAFAENGDDKRASVSHTEVVQDWLNKFHGAERGVLTLQSNASLSAVFPGYSFYSFYFRQYPIARETPESFSAANILVQSPQDEIIHVTTDGELLAFFQSHLNLQQNLRAVFIAEAWLILSPQLLQDGFYDFSAPEIESTQDDALTILGHVNLTNGGKGKVHARLEFSPAHMLLNATTTPDIQSGIRPICQASKLLDSDPIVRKMAAQDILVMGSKAKFYLDEQRLKADPALKKAIDGIWLQIVTEGR